ncbi:unnamed protein product, partial [Ilex paraguariensis]
TQILGIPGNPKNTPAQPEQVQGVRNVEIPPVPNIIRGNEREREENDRKELENRSMMILKEFLKQRPPLFQGTTKPLEAEKWL